MKVKVKKLVLNNFRLFEKLEIQFPDSNFIVLMGENGSGKSAVLDSLGILLSTIAMRITKGSVIGLESLLTNNDITNKYSKSSITLILKNEENQVNIKKIQEYENAILEFSHLFNQALSFVRIDNDVLLPILTYYRINRTFSPNFKEIVLNTNRKTDGYRYAFDKSISSFNDFENWFIDQENLENDRKIKERDFDFEIISLKLIREATTSFLSEISDEPFTNLKVLRTDENGENLDFQNNSNNSILTVEKNGKPVKLKQLSSGEKMVLLIVTDIARRLIILNNYAEDSLNGEGIVLIDEIEMHLHPSWQRRIVPALKKVFPNVQFIVSTHSPQVLSNVSDNDILVLKDGQCYAPDSNPLGRNSNEILEEVFGADSSPHQDLIEEIFVLLNDDNKLEEAEQKLSELRKNIAPQAPVLTRIENIINRKRILNT